MDAGMLCEHAAALVDDLSAARRSRAATDEACVVVIRNEADLLAVGLGRNRQLSCVRVLAYRLFRTIADREDRSRQLRLRQREQEVRLVLRRILAARELIGAGRRPLDARVVAGRDGVGSEGRGSLEERRELQVAVAVRARERRPAG